MFKFKQFTIHQDRTAMKVGTDGVLLGAWADIQSCKNILDIGTGTGLIALMAAQRNKTATIDAIEIEAQAFGQAQENIADSPWADRINLFHTSLQTYHPDKRYDCIICNPPFFNNSTKAPEDNRSLARHSDTLHHDDLINHVIRLLEPTGHFCVILPVVENHLLMEFASISGLYPSRILEVRPTPTKQTKRILTDFIKVKDICQTAQMVLEIKRHEYSKEYIELTHDFYLNM